MINFGDKNKQVLIDDYRIKANGVGEELFEALIKAQEWPINSSGRKTTDEADESIMKLTSRLLFITEKLSKEKAFEVSNVLTRFINLAVTHPELLPELRCAANQINRY